jgi:hypothetical protein
MKLLSDLNRLLVGLARDQRIPDSDKRTLKIMAALVVVMFFVAPRLSVVSEALAMAAMLATLVLFTTVVDYFVNVLDDTIVLSHFAWSMKVFVAVRTALRTLAVFTPRFLRDALWTYSPSPYR